MTAFYCINKLGAERKFNYARFFFSSELNRKCRHFTIFFLNLVGNLWAPKVEKRVNFFLVKTQVIVCDVKKSDFVKKICRVGRRIN